MPMLNDVIIPETGGLISVLCSKGDIKTTWNPDNADEVAAAKKMFDEWKAKNHTAFRVNKKGEAAEIMTEFDPQARAVIMVPRIAGG